MRKLPVIVRQFHDVHEDLQQIKEALLQYFESLFLPEKKKIQIISGRVKKQASLVDKILNKSKVYEDFLDVTDLIGLRIIVNYESDLQEIINKIDQHFLVDEERSVDKIKLLNPDQFGYLSIHRILFLPEALTGRFKAEWHHKLRFELQIRSLLQHAWEKNSRDLDYDNPVGLPIELKRKLHRIAALLELADNQFSEVRNEIDLHIQQVLKNIDHKKHAVPINAISMPRFLEKNKMLKKLELDISDTLDIGLELSLGFIELLPLNLKWINVRSFDQLIDLFQKNKKGIKSFALKRLANHQIIPIGISIWYLCYYEICKSSNQELLEKYIEENAIDFKPQFQSRKALAESLLGDFNNIKKM